MKNIYTNAQLRAIAYTDKKRSATHLATAAKLYTCMSLIKLFPHVFCSGLQTKKIWGPMGSPWALWGLIARGGKRTLLYIP